jgi:hypothetical protein
MRYYATGTIGPSRYMPIVGPTYPLEGSSAMLDPELGYYDNIDNPEFPTHLTRIVLGPHSKVGLTGIELTIDNLRQMAKGKIRAHIGGYIRYADILGGKAEHATKYCYSIYAQTLENGDIQPAYSPCDYWNCADDECKEDSREYRASVARAFKAEGKAVPPYFYGAPMSFLPKATPEVAQARAQELARIADTNTYLVEKSPTAARERSAEIWQMVECRPQPQCDSVTKYMLDVAALTDGRAALVVRAGMDPSNFQTLPDGRKAALTDAERSALQTAVQVGVVLMESNAPHTTLLSDGRSAIVLPTGQTAGLTLSEIAALKKDTELGPLLPPHYRYMVGE